MAEIIALGAPTKRIICKTNGRKT